MSRTELMDMLWPESDGDRQAQNLRRAVADARMALADEGRAPTILLSQGDRFWLNTERVDTDVSQFKLATDAGLAGNDSESNLRSAVELYEGPLLGGLQEGGLQVYRMELEERFGQAVQRLIGLLLESERFGEALLIGRRAIVAAPLREDVHLALSCAYASAGLRAEAIRQFEELETLMQDQWGESPSQRSILAFEQFFAQSQEIAADPGLAERAVVIEPSGGAVPANSTFYIERSCDELVRQALHRQEPTVLVQGARQSGKTSLLLRSLNRFSKAEARVAMTDLQVLNRSQVSNAEAFCRALAYGFSQQSGLNLDLPRLWNEWLGPNMNLHSVVEEVLRQSDQPVIWAIDEADRLFGTDFGDDFFGLIRSWHNLRASQTAGEFSRLTIMISYATEAHLFIQDINQSPFNVGVRVMLNDFGEEEIAELSRRYGLSASRAEVLRILELTGGQPFLARKALDSIVHGGLRVEDLSDQATLEDGPFAEHLRRLLFVASRDPLMKNEVVHFLNGEPFEDSKTIFRLIAGGVLVRKVGGKLDFRVPAYREFLSKYLRA